MSKPDPRLAFTTRNGNKALSLLSEALKKRAGLVVVNGEAGVGKTTLLRKFALQGREAGNAIFLPAQPATSMEGLLKGVCAEGGIKPSGSDRIAHLYALREHLDMRLKTGEFCAIVADNLDGVPDQMLRDLGLLVDLERSNMRPVQIVLAGTPKLIDRLNTPEFNAVRKEVAAVIKLEPFERDETGAYLQHCLSAAGYRGPDLFSFAATERIHAKTRGVPRAINQVAVSALAALKASGGKLSPEAIDVAVARALDETDDVSVPTPMSAPVATPSPLATPLPVAPPGEIVVPASGGIMGQPQTMTVRMMLDKLDREFNASPAAAPAPMEVEEVPAEDPDAEIANALEELAHPPAPTPALVPVVAPAPAPRAQTEQVIAEAVQAIAPAPAATVPTPPPAPPAPAPAPVAAVTAAAAAPAVIEKPTPSAADLVAEALAMVDAEEAQKSHTAPPARPIHAPAPMPSAAAETEPKPHNSARQRLLARLTGR